MTLLHGFPSSSHDWARVAPPLATEHALLLPDFLGFGASDKPADHAYSLTEQADLIEALWAHEGVDSTVLVAHDYAVSVTQELLARRSEGASSVDIVAVHLLNGGLYPDLHRPEPIQTALLDPELGPQISAGITEEALTAALAPTFADGFDSASDSAAMWTTLSRDDGHRLLHLLIRYIVDRRDNEDRWVQALEKTDVPLNFVWGMRDPISGAHMAARIRERVPHAPSRPSMTSGTGHRSRHPSARSRPSGRTDRDSRIDADQPAAGGGLYSSWTAASMSPPSVSTGSMYSRPSATRPSRTTKIVTPRIAKIDPSTWWPCQCHSPHSTSPSTDTWTSSELKSGTPSKTDDQFSSTCPLPPNPRPGCSGCALR